MGIAGNDPITAQQAVEQSNGSNGVPWIGGNRGGDPDQPIKLTGDIVKAGYNVHMNRATTATGTVAATPGARLSQLWTTPDGPRSGWSRLLANTKSLLAPAVRSPRFRVVVSVRHCIGKENLPRPSLIRWLALLLNPLLSTLPRYRPRDWRSRAPSSKPSVSCLRQNKLSLGPLERNRFVGPWRKTSTRDAHANRQAIARVEAIQSPAPTGTRHCRAGSRDGRLLFEMRVRKESCQTHCCTCSTNGARDDELARGA